MWLTKVHTSQEAPTSISGSSSLTKDGLKQKDLSIEEIEKILREEEVNYNNARIYSSEKKLNEVYENYKEELIEEGEDIGFENVNIQKLISVAERKNKFQNSSYKFFLDIKNPSGKINFIKCVRTLVALALVGC